MIYTEGPPCNGEQQRQHQESFLPFCLQRAQDFASPLEKKQDPRHEHVFKGLAKLAYFSLLTYTYTCVHYTLKLERLGLAILGCHDRTLMIP